MRDFCLGYPNDSFYTQHKRSSGIWAHIFHCAVADPWKKAVLAACLAILLALAHGVQASSSGRDALKGSRLFFVGIISLWVAELQVRAGNKASSGCVKKVHEAPSPGCFLLELRILKCILFYFESVKIRMCIVVIIINISKDFISLKVMQALCIRPVFEELQEGWVHFSPARSKPSQSAPS